MKISSKKSIKNNFVKGILKDVQRMKRKVNIKKKCSLEKNIKESHHIYNLHETDKTV